MKTRAPYYLIRRLPNGHVDLHRSEIGFPQVPPVLGCAVGTDAGGFGTYPGMKTIAEYILCDFFGGESDSDLKARLLAPLVGRHLGKLGSVRADLKTDGYMAWTVSESEVADMVAGAAPRCSSTF